MKLSNKNVIYRVLNLFAFVAMIAMNYLAEALPLGGKTTSMISDAYPSLFIPAGYVFLIWGVIYFLLGGFIFFQFLDLFLKRHEKPIFDFIERKTGWFILSCLLNMGWIISWHLEMIGLSLLAITGLFLTLSFLYGELGRYSSGPHPKRFTIFFLAPIRVYFAWICIAIFANAAAVLANIGIWQSLHAQLFLSLVLLIFVVALFLYTLIFFRDYIFTIVGIWAIIGILMKRLLTDPVETYPIILGVIFSLCVIMFFAGKTYKEQPRIQ